MIGGSGLVGRAIARHLVATGWEVDVVGRERRHLPADLREQGVRFVAADRNDPVQVGRAFGTGADLLVDCACYTAAQARTLLPLTAEAACTVMLSSKAVYVDDRGRHSNSDDPPYFSGPIHESQMTLPPGSMPFASREGYGRNKVAAEQVLLDSGSPVTVLRPSKVHGQGARPAREWYFVKRVLDGRPVVLLARQGAGIDHPSAAANIAALVETVARAPGRRILNAADPDAPSGLEIARTVAGYLDHHWVEVLLPERIEALGHHPWDRPHPVVLDTTAATGLGYRPVGDYAQTVRTEVDWLVDAARKSGRNVLRAGYDTDFFGDLFDYDSEDRYLADLDRPQPSPADGTK